MKLAQLIALAFGLTLPLQAGIAGLEPPPKPDAAALAASFEEQMLKVAQYHSRLHIFLKNPDVDALLHGEASDEVCRRALAAILQLQQEEGRTAYLLLTDFVLSAASVYALDPERRSMLHSFLYDAFEKGARREFCLSLIIEAGILSPANAKLAEALFAGMSFSREAFEQQREEEHRLMGTHVPLSNAASSLLCTCMDIDSPALAAQLMKQGVVSEAERAEARRVYRSAAQPYTPAERAEDFAKLEHQFLSNHYGPRWPWPHFLRRSRLERGLSPLWEPGSSNCPTTRATTQLEALARAVEGKADRRLVWLGLEPESWGRVRCLDMAQPLTPATLPWADYALSLESDPQSGATVAELSPAEDEEDEAEERTDPSWQEAHLRLVCAEMMELRPVIDSLQGSREITDGLALEAAMNEQPAALVRLEALGLVAVNDAAQPWRWAVRFALPHGGWAHTSCDFILEGGKWVPAERELCFYFSDGGWRDEDFQDKSRVNCIYPPALNERGKTLLRDYASNEKAQDAYYEQLRALLAGVRDRQSAEAAFAPFRDAKNNKIQEDGDRLKDMTAAIEEETVSGKPAYRGFTLEEFAPENYLSLDDVISLHGLGEYREDDPYFRYYDELLRIHNAGSYGVKELHELVTDEFYFEKR